MMNQDNDKTLVRTRRMPFKAGPNGIQEHGVNVLPIGTHLGEFEILDLIGEGGFGIVYLAYDHSLERHVALKEYMPSGLATRTTKMAVTVRSQHNAGTFNAGLKSFINEARMLAQFDSPSLVKVHRFWEGNGTAYMVMPFYDGITLKQALKERRITPTENWLRLLLSDLFDAIETIHHANCFHRDIAPDNILLLKDGRPLLLDFGAARRVIGDLTQCLTVILKPGFAPIEQYADIAGLRQGAWTDIYALAAVVYYVITGRAPPPAVARMVHDEMVPAHEAGKGRYSSSFLAVLDKALAVKPENRYRSVAELRRALDIMGTVPRTLPGTTMRWSAADIPTTRVADAKPEPQPAAMPERREQQERQEPRFDDRVNGTAGLRQESHGWEAAIQRQPKRRLPTWLTLGLLLSAGVATGVYVGTQQPWKRSFEPAIFSSGGSAGPASSGASGAPDDASAEQPVDTAPPPPSAPSTAETRTAEPQAPPASPTPPVANATPDTTPGMSPNEPPAKAADKPAPAVEESAPPARQLSREEEAWQLASKSDKASAYQRYLAEHPKGLHAAIARLRLESRQPKVANVQKDKTPAAKSKPVQSAEEELWRTASAINEAPAYEAYLHQYPNGGFAAVARDRLASLTPQKPAAPPVAEEEPPQPTPQPEVDAKAEPAPSKPERVVSIKPPQPSATIVPKQPEAAPRQPAQPATETSTASGRQVVKMADQTMSGDFTVDPKTGIVSGKVSIVWTNGNRFDGTLVHGIKEGKGKFIWNNGQRYSGDWARDMPNGKGTLVFANGNRYEGEVKDGVPHGQGVNRFKDGDVYSGIWVAGKMQGRGRYDWANGSYWIGEFRDNKRTENGQMVFADNAGDRGTASTK